MVVYVFGYYITISIVFSSRQSIDIDTMLHCNVEYTVELCYV